MWENRGKLEDVADLFSSSTIIYTLTHSSLSKVYILADLTAILFNYI